jgi:hypothetical protein
MQSRTSDGGRVNKIKPKLKEFMSAKRLKRNPSKARSEWLIGGNVDVAAVIHDGRWIETQVYDHSAPVARRWTITVTDRENGVSFTGTGQYQTTERDNAFRQLGEVPPYATV